MNEKEKIKEMASDLTKMVIQDYGGVYFLETAKALYNLGYRKIPEGSVVLDRQEHQKYCAYKIIEPQIKGCLDRERKLEKQIAELEEQRDKQAYIAEELIQEKHRWTEQARKETAKEIFKEIMKTPYYNEYAERQGYLIRLEKFNEIAKQFGVEVEE